jgi:nucleotide-binding universal stress UspA family protein
VFNRLEQEGRQVLAKCEEVARGRGMTVHTELSSGDPAQRIIEFASACGAELIIVGSRGMGRLERLLMGSVAERVVRFAKSPVLIVK